MSAASTTLGASRPAARAAARHGSVATRLLGAFARAVVVLGFLGLFAPMILVMLVGVVAHAAVSRTKIVKRRPSLGEVLAFVVLVPSVLAALMVPLRAGMQVALLALERGGAAIDPLLRAVVVTPRLDPWLGGCAALLAAIALAGLRQTWSKIAEVENLPTSRARSAAAGLVELAGVARVAPEELRVRELQPSGPAVDWEAVLPPETLLGKDCQIVGEGKARQSATCRITSRFVLEDASGRILVDARGAEVGGVNTVYQFGAPAARVALSKARLVDGDPVYVLGRIEVRADAPASAVDAERLVIRALPEGKRDGGISSLLGIVGNPFARQPHVFLVSDGGESSVRDALIRSMYETFAFETVLLLAGLWLLCEPAALLAR